MMCCVRESESMKNSKDDTYYVGKLLSDIRFIVTHMRMISYDEFCENEILQDSMMFRLIQISENARKLSEIFMKANDTIPWRDIFGLRNRIVHEYGGVDLHIVYDTLKEDIPFLLEQLEER